jgi:hypothetical protein
VFGCFKKINNGKKKYTIGAALGFRPFLAMDSLGFDY